MTSVYAFSYKEEESEVVNKAKEIAKRNNQSFSKLVMEALAKYIDEQKNLIALDNSAISLAVRATNNILYNIYKPKSEQTKIDFFCYERGKLLNLVTQYEKPDLAFMKGHCKEFVRLADMRMKNL